MIGDFKHEHNARHRHPALGYRIDDIVNGDPFQGIGKPEPLCHHLAGAWSRRINDEHRLVYAISPDKFGDDVVTVISCRYHYEKIVRSTYAGQPHAATLRGVETSALESIAELRRVLAVLRGSDQIADIRPLPGLAQLGELIDGYRAAGLRVELRIDGDRRPLPGGVELSVYRIVEGRTGICGRSRSSGPGSH